MEIYGFGTGESSQHPGSDQSAAGPVSEEYDGEPGVGPVKGFC
jgi:hypothetical protein